VSNQRILWGVGTSRTIRPHWALHELGLAFELRPILPRTGETQTPEFTALSARQKVPLLQDDGLVLTESAAITTYLSDAYGLDHNRLLPIDMRERARCLEWCFFVISELDATSLYVIRRHGDLSHIYGEAPIANEAAAAFSRNRCGPSSGPWTPPQGSFWATASPPRTSCFQPASPGRCDTASEWQTPSSPTMSA
jgi:glutathione S-transferase